MLLKIEAIAVDEGHDELETCIAFELALVTSFVWRLIAIKSASPILNSS